MPRPLSLNILSKLLVPSTARLQVISAVKPGIERVQSLLVRLAFENDPAFTRWAERSYGKTPDFRPVTKSGNAANAVYDGPIFAHHDQTNQQYIRYGLLVVLGEEFLINGSHVSRSDYFAANKNALTKFQRETWDNSYPRKARKPLWFMQNSDNILSLTLTTGPLAGLSL